MTPKTYLSALLLIDEEYAKGIEKANELRDARVAAAYDKKAAAAEGQVGEIRKFFDDQYSFDLAMIEAAYESTLTALASKRAAEIESLYQSRAAKERVEILKQVAASWLRGAV